MTNKSRDTFVLREPSRIVEALEACNGNQTKAAAVLGLSRFGLQKMIKRLAVK